MEVASYTSNIKEYNGNLQDQMQSKATVILLNENIFAIRKCARYSELEEGEAAKLYEDRHRQIQSDMMKKLQQKKFSSKKFQQNPRSSSSSGVFGQISNSDIKLKQSLTTRNTAFSNFSNIQATTVSPKIQIGMHMVQSTTLSRTITEDNQECMKYRMKPQRSCELLVYEGQGLSSSAGPSTVQTDVVLHHGYLNPNTFAQKQQLRKEKSESISSNPISTNSYMKLSKNLGNANNSTPQSQSQRQMYSPQSKRGASQNNAYGLSKMNGTSTTSSRHEASPMIGKMVQSQTASQAFYSPSTIKQGSLTNRKIPLENSENRVIRKAESNLGTVMRGQIQAEESKSSTQFHNLGFSNSTVASSAMNSSSYLMQANLKSSLDYAVTAQANANKSPMIKNSQTTISKSANKRRDMEEIDSRILTIEKEIENSNKLNFQKKNLPNKVQGNYQVQKNYSKTIKPTVIIGGFDSKKLQSPQGVKQKRQDKMELNEEKQNLYQEHNGSFNSPNKKVFESSSQVWSRNLNQGLLNLPPPDLQLKNNNKESNYQQKKNFTHQDVLQIQSNDGTISIDNQSYNNTPRSNHVIHDFRPFSKQSTSLSSKKTVNFKGEGNRIHTLDCDDKGKINFTSPSSISTTKSQFMSQSPMTYGTKKTSKFIHSNPTTSTRIALVQDETHENSSRVSQKIQHNLYSSLSSSRIPNAFQLVDQIEGDDEISEFEYLEKIVNGNKTEQSIIDNSNNNINNPNSSAPQTKTFNNQFKQNVAKPANYSKQKEIAQAALNKQNFIFTPQPILHSNSLDSSSLEEKKVTSHSVPSNLNIVSMRQSDILPKTTVNSKTSHINILQNNGQSSSSSSLTTSIKFSGGIQQQIKEGNGLMIKVKESDLSQLSKSSNNQNTSSALANTSLQTFLSQTPNVIHSEQNKNLKNNNFGSPSTFSSTGERFTKSTQALNPNGVCTPQQHHLKNGINRNSNNENNNDINNNNNGASRTPSVNSNNISSISNPNLTPPPPCLPNPSHQLAVPNQKLSYQLNFYNRTQMQMQNRQKTQTDQLNGNREKKPSVEEKQILLTGTAYEKKSDYKTREFEAEDKQGQQAEQIQKILQKKLNNVLETMNQRSDFMKSYRINNNNNNNINNKN